MIGKNHWCPFISVNKDLRLHTIHTQVYCYLYFISFRVNNFIYSFYYYNIFLDKLVIDCSNAEDGLRTTPRSQCSLNVLAIDEPLEYAKLYLDGTIQMWVDAEDFSNLLWHYITFYYLNFLTSDKTHDNITSIPK